MNIYKILIGALLFFVLFNANLFAQNTISPKLEKVFNNFILKVEKKLNGDKEIIFLKTLNSRIIKISEKTKGSIKKQKLLNDLVILSNEKIFELQNKKSSTNQTQILLEISYRGKLRQRLNLVYVADYIKKLKSKNIKILLVSDKFEFVEDNSIKRLVFSKYLVLNSSNYKLFKNKSGTIVVQENGKMYFVEKSEKILKIPYSQAFKYTEGFISMQKKSFKEGNNYFSYNFTNFLTIDDNYGFYIKELENNGIFLSDSLLYLGENKKYSFITNFTKVRLIKDDIIYGITDKQQFLEHLVNDKLYLTGDTDDLFIKLKKEISTLTNGSTQSEKIKKVYSWTLENLEYTQNLDINDKQIFSGILSYKNKNGVCEGYVKLASYALMFAGVANTQVLRGDVVDAADFPKIGHAWLKIGDLYYDPTFDDPIGSTKVKSFGEYSYFGLPRDLLYANRFDYGTTPSILKTKSLDYRKKFVNQRLSKLSDKYKGSNYLVLQGVDYNKSIGLSVGERIDIEKARKILTYGEVTEKSNGEIQVKFNGQLKNIIKLQYYIVTDETIHSVIKQRSYKTDSLYLFKWKKRNGSIEYRLGFDVVIQ